MYTGALKIPVIVPRIEEGFVELWTVTVRVRDPTTWTPESLKRRDTVGIDLEMSLLKIRHVLDYLMSPNRKPFCGEESIFFSLN